jgi:predicted RecA/RadA family phage recombinase
MKNYISEGENVTLTAPYARLSGEGALVGALFGVAYTDLANGEEGAFATQGIFTLAKATGASTGGSQGAKAYWVAGSKSVSAASSGNTLIGVFAATCADGDATAQVRLNGVAV